jgi:hypothetical protein
MEPIRATLAELFTRSRGAPQDVGGVPVHNIYRRAVSDGQVVLIRRIHAAASPQGLRVKVDKGAIEVNGRKLKDVVLWSDGSPQEIEIQCDIGKRTTGELRVWNCWKDEKGVMQAWLGDAGIVIDETEDRVELRCGDGTHRFDPKDLVVELRFR